MRLCAVVAGNNAMRQFVEHERQAAHHTGDQQGYQKGAIEDRAPRLQNRKREGCACPGFQELEIVVGLALKEAFTRYAK